MALIYNASFDSQNRVLSLLDKAGNVISSCEVPSKSNELTLTATADKSSVKLIIKKGTLSNTYEVDTGNGWQSYTFGTVIPLNTGQSCKWRCSAHPTTQSTSNYVQFEMTGTIEASGNCNSMLSSDFENITSLSEYEYAFYSLFRDCKSLTKAPSLPAMALGGNCYQNMFGGCESLTQAPELPATRLTFSCYAFMFSMCKSLMQAPLLPAKYLYQYCYQNMLSGCSKLKEVRIAATSIAKDALLWWLSEVPSPGDFYCDPYTTFPSGTSGIPSGWRRLNINNYPSTP